MNILIISQYFWPENFRINGMARGLIEQFSWLITAKKTFENLEQAIKHTENSV